MVLSGTCGSCGFRLPASDFPVAKSNPSKRVLAVCNTCLGQVCKDHDDTLSVRPATAAEDALYRQEQVDAKLKRKRDDATLAARHRRLPSPDPTNLTCRICCEDKDFMDFPVHTKRLQKGVVPEIPIRCQPHVGPRAKAGPVCKSCIGRSLTAAVEVKGAAATGCFECNSAWHPKHIQSYVADDIFKTYSDELFKVKITHRANFLWCPNVSCEFGGLTYKKSSGWPQVECAHCGTRACAECKVAWHTGISCSLAKATRQYGESELENLKQLETLGAKMCPSCHVVIEKNGGCFNMCCSRCRKPFNWDKAESVVRKSNTNKAPNQPSSAGISTQVTECEADRAIADIEDGGEHARQRKRTKFEQLGLQTAVPAAA